MNPKVSIIIVNYNSSDDTIECVESLIKLKYDNFEVIVVDNASRTEEREKLLVLQECTKLIFNDSNLGFAGGNNIGIELAMKHNGDYIMLLNEDTIVDEDLINSMLIPFQKDLNVGIVSPQIFSYKNRNQIQNAGAYINWWRGTTKSSIKTEFTGNGFYTTFATGCCMLIRRDLFERVGMLSEDYFLYYEDTDFSARTMSAGYKLWFEPSAHIYHKGGASSIRWSPNYQYYITRNRMMFIKKYAKFPPKIVAYIFTYAFVIKAIAKGKGEWKDLGDGLKAFYSGDKGVRK